MVAKQVVIIEHRFQNEIYNAPNIDILLFDLRQFDDRLPDKHQIENIREHINKILIPEAKESMEEWLEENTVGS